MSQHHHHVRLSGLLIQKSQLGSESRMCNHSCAPRALGTREVISLHFSQSHLRFPLHLVKQSVQFNWVLLAAMRPCDLMAATKRLSKHTIVALSLFSCFPVLFERRPPLYNRSSCRSNMSVVVLSRPLDVRSDDRERVLAKIQAFVVDWLDQLAGGDLPSFEEQCVHERVSHTCYTLMPTMTQMLASL